MKKKVRVSHKVIERIHEYVSMDCYGYRIRCSCGTDVCGWTTDEVESRYMRHITG